MKNTIYALLVALSLYTSASQGEADTDIVTSALSPEFDAYISSYPASTRSSTKGFLEETKMAVGVLLTSHHFKKYDDYDYQESNNGIYLNIESWSTGTYRNSADEQSAFVAYNSNLYKNGLFQVGLVTGIANGYDGWQNAQGDYMPILGFSTQWAYLKTILSYDALALGIELPLN